MITLLTKIFIKDPTDIHSQDVRHAYGVLCSVLGISLNILLFLGKLLAGLLARSISITADAFNNLSDAGSSLITLIGFKLGRQKPDSDHPFGHGRLEYISGLIVAFLILLMGVELVKSSVDKIIHPEALNFSPLIIVILVISILVKLYMSFYNRSIGKKIDSAAMKATATDSISDVFATSVVLIATLVSHFSGLHIDGWCGVMVGLLVSYAGICAAKDTIDPLLGQAPDPAFVKDVQQIVLSKEGVLGIHDMIVHNYGPGRVIISLHAEVPAEGDVLEMHDLIDTIEHELSSRLNCSAVIHMDPVSTEDEETMLLKEKVHELILATAPEVTMHDFRVVKGPTHTNLIFDIVVPYEYPMKDEEVVAAVTAKIKELDARYFAVIQVDHSFT